MWGNLFDEFADAVLEAFSFLGTTKSIGECVKDWSESIGAIINMVMSVLRFDALLKPVKELIEKAIQALIEPLTKMVDFKLPPIPSINFSLIPDMGFIAEYMSTFMVHLDKFRATLPDLPTLPKFCGKTELAVKFLAKPESAKEAGC